MTLINDPEMCRRIDKDNSSLIDKILDSRWDAVLVGNVDLLGPEILFSLLKSGHKVCHHVGFIDPPYPYDLMPKDDNYKLIASSHAVLNNLRRHGFPIDTVVYPGCRTELFGRRDRSLTPLCVSHSF